MKEFTKVLSGLGNLLRNTGAYQEADQLLRRSLELRRESLGPEAPEVATSLSDLGNLLLDTGDLEGARDFHEQALRMREQSLGPHDPALATSLNNLAIVARRSRDNE
ncbi:MAG: tetratricopeptide repeat protein, partial [Xanthomonadales bacterium]|nr:tetratricopeptide repeat protein [Xanthomonadales bacterium]NIX14157.1 tetratricopeptide repeat protein [Xanthomonadales bacterium]